MNQRKIIYLLVGLVILAGVGYLAWTNYQAGKIKKISSFEECVKAGYPIMETYPEQCKTPDGRNFVNAIPVPNPTCKNLCGDGICQEVVCQAIGCPCAESKDTCPQDCPSAAIANPASVNCERLGGKVVIRSDAQGNQTGYCQLKNGQECEEWALFRNECNLGSSSQMGILEGQVTVGPICPVQRPDQPCPVPASAYTSRTVIIFKSDGKTEVARQNFDSQGKYHFELVPGVYIVDIPHQGGLGSSKDLPQTVIISAGQTTKLDFSIDTGIR